jgi:hypothetical protein
MDKELEAQVLEAWRCLPIHQKAYHLAYSYFLAAIYAVAEDLMKRYGRAAFVTLVVAYIAFFMVFADRFPRQVFVAGVILGLILGALAVVMMLPNRHNGDNHNHNDSP